MQFSFTVAEIGAITRATTSRGSTTETIRGISALREAAAGDLSFLGNAKYKGEVATSKASLVLVPPDFAGEPGANQAYLVVESPSVALALLCARIEQALWPKPAAGIHPTASIAPGAKVAASASIGPLCVVESGAVIGERTHLQAHICIGRNAVIGDDCWLMPGVVVASECRLGQRVRIQPGAVIGSEGFGYELVKGRHEKIPQVGIVEIGDDVEIGANTTLDRARFSRTVIGEGTKIDNLVQIGHNVIVGRHCLLCAQVGISGSTKLEDYVVLGGQVGLGGHITIGKGVKAGGQAGITTDIAAGSFVNGTPAIPFQLERRIAVLQQRLPDLFRRVDALEAELLSAKKSSS
jgi:UDP-3-O-[3-hydroxymyristoyl] glucosamine N-acyltransferase